jgi:hypothetical protein
MLIGRQHRAISSMLRTRYQHVLTTAAAILAIMDEEDDFDTSAFRGRLLGSKHIKRTRKKVDNMFAELGHSCVRAYKSSLVVFNNLYSTLKPYLIDQFGESKRGRPNGPIHNKLRLSIAIRFFCGASIYDIQLSHGVSKPSVYRSVYGVINAVNKCPHMTFNQEGAQFPSHEEQRIIAQGFFKRSAAEFGTCCGAIDGMLVWTNQPSQADCIDVGIGERSFHCSRKDKFGMILMAICDHNCKFRWADITHPGIASDLTSWLTSPLGIALEESNQNIIAPGFCLFGDNAFVENQYMSVPIPGKVITSEEDAYNFYLSQLRITIERAFGILVHRFGILRGPLALSIKKVPALVMCLLRLHNFYIDACGKTTEGGLEDDEAFVQWRAFVSNNVAVSIDRNGVPADLVGAGHHRRDQGDFARRSRQGPTIPDRTTPMRKLMQHIADCGYVRPPIKE